MEIITIFTIINLNTTDSMSELKIGDTAPAFKGVDQDDKEISLSDYKGKKVVLYFYPKDNTPGCTAEACSLRDGYAELKKMGFEVIGVSGDSAASHRKFIAKHSLPFPLIADTDRTVALAYDVYSEKIFCGRKCMGIVRKTFIIDENGKIEKIFDKVKTKEHFIQIVDSYK